MYIRKIFSSIFTLSVLYTLNSLNSFCSQQQCSQSANVRFLWQYIHHSPGNSRRGFGIDCAILTCQVYISQILVASALGAVVDAVGTVRVIPMVASGGSCLAFLAAAFLVIYPDTLDDEDDDDEEEQGPGSVKSEAASNSSAEKPRNKPETESSV